MASDPVVYLFWSSRAVLLAFQGNTPGQASCKSLQLAKGREWKGKEPCCESKLPAAAWQGGGLQRKHLSEKVHLGSGQHLKKGESKKKEEKLHSESSQKGQISSVGKNWDNVWMKWCTVRSIHHYKQVESTSCRSKVLRRDRIQKWSQANVRMAWRERSDTTALKGRCQQQCGVTSQGLSSWFSWPGTYNTSQAYPVWCDSCPGNSESELALVPDEGKDEGTWRP